MYALQVCFNKTGPNSGKTVIDSDKYGHMEMTETYSDEGIDIQVVAKDKGVTIREFWQRQVKETGWFRMVKEDGGV